jgi:hypothetical protein
MNLKGDWGGGGRKTSNLTLDDMFPDWDSNQTQTITNIGHCPDLELWTNSVATFKHRNSISAPRREKKKRRRRRFMKDENSSELRVTSSLIVT